MTKRKKFEGFKIALAKIFSKKRKTTKFDLINIKRQRRLDNEPK